MLTSIAALVLLAASAVSAQDTAPSVVTFISISPSPASEALFTIQTGVPASASMACNCIQEPCAACTSDGGILSIPAGEVPVSSTATPANTASRAILSGTAPPRQTSNAAALAAQSKGSTIAVGLLGAALALL